MSGKRPPIGSAARRIRTGIDSALIRGLVPAGVYAFTAKNTGCEERTLREAANGIHEQR